MASKPMLTNRLQSELDDFAWAWYSGKQSFFICVSQVSRNTAWCHLLLTLMPCHCPNISFRWSLSPEFFSPFLFILLLTIPELNSGILSITNVFTLLLFYLWEAVRGQFEVIMVELLYYMPMECAQMRLWKSYGRSQVWPYWALDNPYHTSVHKLLVCYKLTLKSSVRIFQLIFII